VYIWNFRRAGPANPAEFDSRHFPIQVEPHFQFPKARVAALRVLDLDPCRSPRAHSALGHTVKPEESCQKGLRMDSESYVTYSKLLVYYMTQNFNAALPEGVSGILG